ncbi:MAG: MGMT family protein [Candidatus Bathyarchaeia archaeon]
MGAHKTWREKLEAMQERKIVDTPKGRMLVSKPLDVDALIRKIPAGRLATIGQMRARLAKDFGADYTCPLTTGIFLRIAAEAAEEELKRGEAQVAPYWRIVRNDGSLNEKLPGGVEAQAARLRGEGHTIEQSRGKGSFRVKGFERSLAEI